MLGKSTSTILTIISMSFCLITKAQDPQFSQFYANSLYLNPGFTGNTRQLRFATSYRNQWPSIPKGFVSYTAAVDYNAEEINSGFGLIAAHDKAGSGGLSFTNIGLSYAYQLQLSRKLGLRPGIRISYSNRNADLGSYLFSDQIVRGGASATIEQFQENVRYLDLSSGVVFAHLEKYWAGISFDHINTPRYGLLDSEARLPIKTSIHLGWNFEIKPGDKIGKPTTFRLIAHYKNQQDWDQLDIGGYFETSPMVFGLWYRGIPLLKSYKKGYTNNEAFVFLVGIKTNNLKIGYSYDFTISKLYSNTGGAHEISLIYEIASRRKKRSRRRFLVPCAKF